MASLSDTGWDRWRDLVAIGLVAGDVSPATIARCSGVSRLEVLEAFAQAREFGVMDEDGKVQPGEATRLVADLAIDVVSHVHTEMARHYLSSGREGLERAIAHARQVTSAADTEAIVALCDHSGEVNLSLGDYRLARRLFEVADDLDLVGSDELRGRRLLLLAAAVDGEGDVLAARKLLVHAGAAGERSGDIDLVVEAAVRHALPTDWYAGDHQSLVMLQRAAAQDLSPDQSVKVMAARGVAEMRIPVLPERGQQLAWITRPEVAQPLTEQALAESEGLSAEARAMALLAWRATHRSPRYLAQRQAVTKELLTLGQELRRPALQVDAAVYLAVDAVESADRQLFDKALGVARWVAESEGSARLLWRAHTLAAGGAFLDGESDSVTDLARRAEESGQLVNAPGWLAGKMFFLAQRVITSDDPEQMSHLLFDESQAGMNNPLALSGIAYCFARCDQHAVAHRYARKALRQLDFESSPLLLLTRVSAVALELDDLELRRELLELMEPWLEHVSVDSSAWWCDGPVSLWAALLEESLGEIHAAREHAEMAHGAVNRLHDVRSRRRLRTLMKRLSTADGTHVEPPLSSRELEVLRMLSSGATNAQIADALNYSVSTVRNDTVSIYRKLEVNGRAEAVAKAVSLGLLRVDTPA